MAKLTLKRTLTGFAPADDESQAEARHFAVGQSYRATIIKPRSLKSLRRYWALVNMVYSNTDMFKSKEHLHQFLKIRAGHFTEIVAKSTGEVFQVADSIDFDTLDETAFAEVWRRVVDVICQDILPGVSEIELETEIQKLCGLAA